MTREHAPSHALVLGCGRSGTSIFGELFETLPRYCYASEPEWEQVLATDFSTPQAIKVPREPTDGPTDVGLSFAIEDLLALAEPVEIFWITRHPYDAVASLKVGISQNWGHHPRPPDWEDHLHRPLVEKCAYHWAYLNTHGLRSVGNRAHIVRFEDLIAAPIDFAERVMRIVNAVSKADFDAASQWSARVQNRNNDAFVEAKTSREYSRNDHIVKVGRWRENLDDEELSLIRPVVAETADLLGYELPPLR